MRGSLTLRDFDWVLFGVAVLLAAIGVMEIYSTTVHSTLAVEYKRQIYWILLGCAVTLIVCQFDYHLILEQSVWLYVLTILSLGGVLAFAPRVAGARRWLRLGGTTFQVSELAKLVIIVAVAAFLAEQGVDTAVTWGQLLKLGILVGLPAALVALEPDLGTALTLAPIAVAAVFLAGVRWRQLGILLLLGTLLLPVGWHVLKPYQRERLEAFLHPTQNVQGSGYQVMQTKIAIGSGGLWGTGLGNGTQSRLGFIPVSHADAIFAAFAEEQGFVGTLLVLLLYLILLVRLLDSAQMAADRAGAFLMVGLASVLFFQIIVNVGMMIGLFPITGIPLPFMSQGGSSILVVFTGLGLAMSVRMRRFVN